MININTFELYIPFRSDHYSNVCVVITKKTSKSDKMGRDEWMEEGDDNGGDEYKTNVNGNQI